MATTAVSVPARSVSRSLPRFLVGGAFTTGASWLCYVALLRVVRYEVAYTLSFVVGIAISFLVNSWFVFGVPLRWRRLLPYPFAYLLQYAAGYAVVWLAVEKLGMPEWSGPLVALVVTIPLGFMLTRRVLVGAGGGAKGEPRPASP